MISKAIDSDYYGDNSWDRAIFVEDPIGLEEPGWKTLAAPSQILGDLSRLRTIFVDFLKAYHSEVLLSFSLLIHSIQDGLPEEEGNYISLATTFEENLLAW